MDNGEEKKKKYISSSILLEMAKDEYSKEHERTKSLDSKASFFITVIVAIATIFVPVIPFDKLLSVYQTGSCPQKLIVSTLLLFVILATISLIFAFIKLYNSYNLTKYKRPNLECISEDSYHLLSNDKLHRQLCDYYKTVVDANLSTNEKKCQSIAAGIKYCGIGILLLTFSAIGLLITIGG